MIAFAMALLIISGEIDLSVPSIIALASTAMGLAVQYEVGTPVLAPIGLSVGLLCGAFNAVFVTVLGLPSIVVTIGTMSLFRGINYIILGDWFLSGILVMFHGVRAGIRLVDSTRISRLTNDSLCWHAP